MHCPNEFYPIPNIQDEVGVVKFLEYKKADELIGSFYKYALLI